MADLTTNEKKVSSSSHIPDEIALCILSKLPVKSLKRFICARKSWSVLFENSDFLNKFRNNLVSKSVPLYDDACFLFKRTMYGTTFSLGLGKDEIVLDLNLPSIFLDNGNQSTEILGSAIDGIVCLYDCFNHTTVVLWNPNTRKMKLVPPTPVKKYLPDGLESAYCLHGFGYDCVQDDFKIILYVNCDLLVGEGEYDYDSFWEIYSLKSNSWRRLNGDHTIPFLESGTKGLEVYLNGMCHWLGLKDDQTYLVSFNLSNEVFLSAFVDECVSCCYKLVVLNGSVAMIKKRNDNMSFDISIFGEIGVKESRISLFNVGLGRLSSPIEESIAAGKKGKIFFKEKDGKVVSLDLTTWMIEKIDFEGNSCIEQIVFYKASHRRLKK
ncbi:unnamed protein product [Trifolium pratense]|uniref:Uncharacterized protein n=1 Tax=Trifolium pratense TaxID=57577 RepID=A0ACB0L4Z7_TRIPR|nr:unnamed protein product [Trifolium pratense]